MVTNKGYSLRLEQSPHGARFLSGGMRPLTLSVTNSSGISWQVSKEGKRIIKAIWSNDREVTVEAFKPIPLMKPVGSGESILVKMPLPVPKQPGKYRLTISLTTDDDQLLPRLMGDPLVLDVHVERPERYTAGSIQPIISPGKGVVCGQKIEVPVSVVNQSETVWSSTSSEAVQLSYHWRKEDRVVIWDGLRTSLPAPLAAGASALTKMAIQMPAAPGTYQLQLTAVCKQWGWFEQYAHTFSAAAFDIQCHDQQNVDEDLAREMEKWPIAAALALERASIVAWKEQSEHVGQRDLMRIASQIDKWPVRPVFSVIMPVFNPPIRFLRDAVESVRGQLYPHWELCIADDASSDPEVRKVLEEYRGRDPRIQVNYRSRNGHISAASNTALSMAKGDYIVLLDHDDRLPVHALYCYAGEIMRDPELRWLYSDMEIIDEDNRPLSLMLLQPPDKERFRTWNYMGAHTVYRKDVLSAAGGFREGYEGSQDYDLGLRVIEKIPFSAIRHLPFLLYQWRRFEGSAASGVMSTKPYAVTATQRSVSDHLARSGIAATVKPTRYMNRFEVRYRVAEPAPLVTIIVPTRDRFDLLRCCINSILGHTTYSNYELLIADNESADPETLGFLHYLQEGGFARILPCPGEFNYSAIINRAVEDARGDIVCILNNDMEVIHEEWLTVLVGLAQQPDVGIVGAMLLYDNYTVQQGGVLFNENFVPQHCFRGASPVKPGEKNLLMFPCEVPALTGACQVMRKRVFSEVGGLDDRHLKIAFSDIDLCLKVMEAGYRNLYTPFARLFHWESASRGSRNEKGAAYSHERAREAAFLYHNWITRIQTLDARNPNQNVDGVRMPVPRQTVGQMIRKYDIPVHAHLAFLHIPKAAGCSFRDWVRSHLSGRDVTVLAGATNLACYDGSEEHLSRVKDSLKRSRAVYSHFTYGFHEKVGLPLCYATLLRDPVSRVWSAWHYLRQNPMSPLYGMELDDIEPLVRKQLLSGNLMTRMLAGERPEPVTVKDINRGPNWHALGFVGFNFPALLWTHGAEAALQMPDTGPDNDPRLLERAMRNIERFFFIGRVEAIDQAAEALAAALDWDPGHLIPRINEGKGEGCKETPGGPKRRLIEEYNQLDIQLYQYVSAGPNGYILNKANRDG